MSGRQASCDLGYPGSLAFTIALPTHMNAAVISDIHANLPALETVLAEIDRVGVDEIWCLGDAVGYGARPSECVELLAERTSLCLVGNHDLAALGEIDISTFSPSAAEASRWTRKNLSKEALNWLSGLEGSSAIREDIGLFHASPRDPVWEYVIDTDLAEECLDVQDERVALVGHSHIALFFTRMDELSRLRSGFAPGGTSESFSRGQWLINPGSVGQPRDGHPDAAWLLLDLDADLANFHRVKYDIDTAAGQIRDAELPTNLADRLYLGH